MLTTVSRQGCGCQVKQALGPTPSFVPRARSRRNKEGPHGRIPILELSRHARSGYTRYFRSVVRGTGNMNVTLLPRRFTTSQVHECICTLPHHGVGLMKRQLDHHSLTPGIGRHMDAVCLRHRGAVHVTGIHSWRIIRPSSRLFNFTMIF